MDPNQYVASNDAVVDIRHYLKITQYKYMAILARNKYRLEIYIEILIQFLNNTLHNKFINQLDSSNGIILIDLQH